MLSTHLDPVQPLRVISILLLDFCVGDAHVGRDNIAFRVVLLHQVCIIVR